MNRKQRVLTIIALVAFVVIGVCHYIAVATYADYSRGRMVEQWVFPTPEPALVSGISPFDLFAESEAKERAMVERDRYLEKHGVSPVPDVDLGAVLAKKGVTPAPTPTAKPSPTPVKEQVPDPDIRHYLEWTTPSESMVPDVRMPWFMLGVIYTGLFFLLADRKERR